jgi:hypothetical protein
MIVKGYAWVVSGQSWCDYPDPRHAARLDVLLSGADGESIELRAVEVKDASLPRGFTWTFSNPDGTPSDATLVSAWRQGDIEVEVDLP